jgi:hypothetical protein
MLYKQRDAFGLSFVSDKIDFISDVKSNYAHKNYVYTILEQLLARNYKNFPVVSDISQVIHQIAERIHKRSLVIIFSDLISLEENPENFIKSLQHLRYNKHEVILFHIFDKNLEEGLQYKNRPYKFVDVETNQEIKVNPSQVRDKYEQQMQMIFSMIHKACNDMHIDYVECDINKTYDQILLPYFYKRIRMR